MVERILTREFFDRPVLEVAPDLLGRIVRLTSAEGTVAVSLSEVEAYDGDNDPGSHAYRGPTRRNAVMFGPPGHLYVYFSYGVHWCGNLVAGPPGRAAAVLLRAGEVTQGLPLARRRRPAVRRDADLARGPARLMSTLGVTGALNGLDACLPGGPLRVSAGSPPQPDQVRVGPRVGVGGPGAATAWRFWVDGHPTVSPYRPAVRRQRGDSQGGDSQGGDSQGGGTHRAS